MKNALLVFILFFVAGLINRVSALPSQCLQAPSRLNVCPHIIYKKAALAVEALDVKKGNVICLCLSDLNELSATNMSKVQQIDQQVSFEPLLKKYQLSEQDILSLMKY